MIPEVGADEAYRAFHEDDRWQSADGSVYVFVNSIAESGSGSIAFVFPPNPSREGTAWGPLVDDYRTDFVSEHFRMTSIVDAGWLYYSFLNPTTGRTEPKASYLIEIDWTGNRAAVGAGIYRRDIPGTCESAEVNAAVLEAEPSEERLRDFVRCAAEYVVEHGTEEAHRAFVEDQRWRHGPYYVFVRLLAKPGVYDRSRLLVFLPIAPGRGLRDRASTITVISSTPFTNCIAS